ncbi:MAG: response regulator [candidate division WOR-3 bacterium]|nr:MAG: response regulator [candidate division WOR-3 bacterium]
MRVLIVDDAMFMRRMLSDILEKGGHTVCGEASTGKEAVDRYKEVKPDLVTMDIIMPDMSGIEAVKEIKKIDAEAKILMVSAMGQQALVLEAVQAGALDYVVKPFQPSRVLESIDRIINK